MRESDLPGHLAEGDGGDNYEGGDAIVFADDYAIGEALKVLKTMPPAVAPAKQSAAATAPATTH